MVHISLSSLIVFLHLFYDLLVASLAEHLQFLMERYLRQLFCRATHSVQFATIGLLGAQTVVMLMDWSSCASPLHHSNRRKSVIPGLRGIEASYRSLLVVKESLGCSCSMQTILLLRNYMLLVLQWLLFLLRFLYSWLIRLKIESRNTYMWYLINKMSGLLVIWMHAWWWFSRGHNLHGFLLLILLWACSGLLDFVDQVSTSSAILRVVKEAIHRKVGPCRVATLGVRMLLVHNWNLSFDLLFRSLGTNWVWSNSSHSWSGKPSNCTFNLLHLRLDDLLLSSMAGDVLNVDILISVSHSCWILSLSGLASSVFAPEKCSEEVFTVIISFPALIQIMQIFVRLTLVFLISLVDGVHILRVEVHPILVFSRMVLF